MVDRTPAAAVVSTVVDRTRAAAVVRSTLVDPTPAAVAQSRPAAADPNQAATAGRMYLSELCGEPLHDGFILCATI